VYFPRADFPWGGSGVVTVMAAPVRQWGFVGAFPRPG
jgi:hypothetical protein